MKTEFTLGRAANNDIVIENTVVGRKHLLILFKSEHELIIEDLDSNNATFINQIRIKKKSVTPEDSILLGSYELNSKFLFSEITKKVNESRTDFTKEFFELKTMYEDYEKKVNEIKTIWISLKIGRHDLEYKKAQIEKFLTKKKKVKIEITLKGREKAHFDLASQLLENLIKDLANKGKIDESPKKQGNKIFALINPL